MKTINDHAAFIQATSDRLECLKLIESITGSKSAVVLFMRSRQPALDDLTGEELLEDRPHVLLERLRLLERGDQ